MKKSANPPRNKLPFCNTQPSLSLSIRNPDPCLYTWDKSWDGGLINYPHIDHHYIYNSCWAQTDPYENIYTVIRGTKHFVLLPPTEGFLLAERLYPRAVYARRRQGGVANGGDSIQGQLPLELVPVPRREDDKQQQQQDNSDLIEDDKSSDDDDEEVFDPNMVSWASIDPTNLLSSAEHEKLLPNEFSKYARPIHVTLHEGEALYLPSGWWHHVSQSSSSSPSPSPSRSSPTSNDDDLLEQDQHRGGRGVCIALNWWYDMEMRGDRWVWLSALRRRPTRQEPAQQN